VKPEQLLQIETNSPHIALRSQEIWRYLITRDFQDKGVEAVEKATSRALNKKQEDNDISDVKTTENDNIEINFRKIYKKLEATRKANLDMASDRLRANIAKMNQDKDNWKITQLNTDPQSVRSNALRKLAPSAPIGSRMLHKAIKHTLDHGPSIFSPRNVHFVAKNNLQLNNRVIRPPRGRTDFNRPYNTPPSNPYTNIMKRKASSPITSSPSYKRIPTKMTTKSSTTQKLFSIKPPTLSNHVSSFPVSTDIRYKATSTKMNPPNSANPVKSAISKVEKPTNSALINKRRHSEVPIETSHSQPSTSASDQASSISPPRKIFIRQRKAPSIFITKR
jgi:hypothetical protein